MQRQTITAVLAVKNEEKIIAKCLAAIKDWIDEIIIIDNGSIDKTTAICKKYGCKIYSHNKEELIPFLQNIGIQKATKDWILVLDADVIVTHEAAEEIKKRIQNKEIDGFYLPHKTIIMQRCMKSPFWTFLIFKLFRRKKAYFKGEYAHEDVTFSGKNVETIKNALLHYSHPSLALEVKKINRYTSQDAKKMYETKRGGLLKRKLKRVTLYQLFISPFLYFLYLFIYRKGYLDEIHGFIVDVNLAYYVFLETAKVWEIEVSRNQT